MIFLFLDFRAWEAVIITIIYIIIRKVVLKNVLTIGQLHSSPIIVKSRELNNLAV